MRREALKFLLDWKQRPSRSPLLLRGARQVGKTFLVESFGKTSFENTVTINFESQFEYAAFFERLNAAHIIQQIEKLSRQQIVPGKTLLFLDEIQMCPRAILALRYFKEQLPELHVVAAGSLLEFVLKEPDFSLPVGRVEFLYLKPLSFYEYLEAIGKADRVAYLKAVNLEEKIPEPVHRELLDDVYEYSAIGGMPAVVKSYLDERNIERCQELQSFLLQTYRGDFGKYANRTQHQNLQRIFIKLPQSIAKHFKYVDIDREMRAEEIRHALLLLRDAGLLNIVYANTLSGLPLSSCSIEKYFKLLFLDIGLLTRAKGLPAEMYLQRDRAFLDRGEMAEQWVGQELLHLQPHYQPAELYYWQRNKPNSLAEVDFVIMCGEHIVPIEVKAGQSGRLRSLHELMREMQLSLGVKIAESSLSIKDKIIFLPFYMIRELTRLAEAALS